MSADGSAAAAGGPRDWIVDLAVVGALVGALGLELEQAPAAIAVYLTVAVGLTWALQRPWPRWISLLALLLVGGAGVGLAWEALTFHGRVYVSGGSWRGGVLVVRTQSGRSRNPRIGIDPGSGRRRPLPRTFRHDAINSRAWTPAGRRIELPREGWPRGGPRISAIDPRDGWLVRGAPSIGRLQLVELASGRARDVWLGELERPWQAVETLLADWWCLLVRRAGRTELMGFDREADERPARFRLERPGQRLALIGWSADRRLALLVDGGDGQVLGLDRDGTLTALGRVHAMPAPGQLRVLPDVLRYAAELRVCEVPRAGGPARFLDEGLRRSNRRHPAIAPDGRSAALVTRRRGLVVIDLDGRQPPRRIPVRPHGVQPPGVWMAWLIAACVAVFMTPAHIRGRWELSLRAAALAPGPLAASGWLPPAVVQVGLLLLALVGIRILPSMLANRRARAARLARLPGVGDESATTQA